MPPQPPAVAPAPAAPSPRARLAFGLYAAQILTLFGLAVSNGFHALALLAAPWTVAWRELPWQRLRPLFAAIGLYLLFLFAAIAASTEPALSLGAVSEVFSLASLALAALSVRGEAAVRRLVDLVVLAATAFGLHGLAQYLVGYGDLDLRIRGPFSHYMTFSGVLLLADLLLIALLVRRVVVPPEPSRFFRALRSPAFRWGALAVLNLALLGSLTRSAWVAAAVAFTVLVLTRAPRLLFAYLPAAALFVLLAPVPWLARALSIADLGDTSNYDRLCMVAAGARMVAERPLLGIGPDLVKHRYPIYREPTAPRLGVPHLHNTYVHIAAERGLLSLTALLALLGLPAVVALRRLRRCERARSGPIDLYSGTLAALAAFAVAGLFEYNWGDAEVQRVLLAVLALPFCLEGERTGDA